MGDVNGTEDRIDGRWDGRGMGRKGGGGREAEGGGGKSGVQRERWVRLGRQGSLPSHRRTWTSVS